MNQVNQSRQKVYDYCRLMLGDGMVDVELDPIHYETALNRAFAVYRQRGDSAVEESFVFLTLLIDQNEYILPAEIQQVRQVYRRSVGSRTGGGAGGTVFEPFNMAYTNTYLLSSTNMGGLLTYELFAQYQKLVGKMFGSNINFSWYPQSNKLIIHQRPRADEEVMLWVYNKRPDSVILEDTYAGQWIKDYSLANCKIMLGQARGKFASIAGPQSGTQLNGKDLISEGKDEIEQLTKDLMTQVTGGTGYSFLIG